MEFVTTETETEALLLETNLIKSLKPRFNVLMRDDKSFPYILLTGDHRRRNSQASRRAHAKGRLFRAVRQRLGRQPDDERAGARLPGSLLLRSVFATRTRPCLLYQIKRCSAPCTGEISPTTMRSSSAKRAPF